MTGFMRSGPLRVLVVDDNIDFALSFGQLLEVLGCAVEVAHDARSALLKAVPRRPHLVFMDLNLGRENGSQVMAVLRRMLHDDEGLTIVCLTGEVRPDIELECRKAGFDLFMHKPMPTDLLREVLSACEQRVEAAQRSHAPAAVSTTDVAEPGAHRANR
jgi:CheY-like chemotaxis protein